MLKPVILSWTSLTRRKIPVIAIDIPMPGANFYGVDNFRAGQMAGEALGRWIVQHWGGRLDHLLRLEFNAAGPVPGARILGQQVGLESTLGFLADERIISVDTPGILDPTPICHDRTATFPSTGCQNRHHPNQ